MREARRGGKPGEGQGGPAIRQEKTFGFLPSALQVERGREAHLPGEGAVGAFLTCLLTSLVLFPHQLLSSLSRPLDPRGHAKCGAGRDLSGPWVEGFPNTELDPDTGQE